MALLRFQLSFLWKLCQYGNNALCDACFSPPPLICLHRVCFSADRSSTGVLVLTELIGVPLPPSVSFVTGFEGYPAYSFGPDANVGRLTKSFIPDPFFYDFAITVTAKPTTRRGGVLFAITDAYQKVGDANFWFFILCKLFYK